MNDVINLEKCYEADLSTNTLPLGRAVTIQDNGAEGIAIGTLQGNKVLPRQKDIGDLSQLPDENLVAAIQADRSQLAEQSTQISDLNTNKADITEINNLATEKANQVDLNNVQGQITSLVLGAVGDGNNAEVVQAKVDAGGIMHDVLKGRIDAIENGLFNYTQFGYTDLSDASYSSGWSRVITNKIPITKKGTVYVTFKAYGTNQYIQHIRPTTSDSNVVDIVKTVSVTATDGNVVTVKCDFDIVGDGKDYIAISGCYFNSTTITNGYVQLLTTFDIARTTYSNFSNGLNTTAEMGYYVTVADTNTIASDKVVFSDKFTFKGSISDCNNATETGSYIIIDGSSNSPVPSGFLDVVNYGNYIIHVAKNFNTDGILYIRKYTESTDYWGSWFSSELETVLPLTGKVGVCFGDSITEFGNYPDIIAQITGATMYNVGIGGTRLAYDASETAMVAGVKLIEYIINDTLDANSSAVYNNVDITSLGKTHYTALRGIDFNTVDFVTFAYSANDYWANIALDGGTDTDQTKFKDALRYCIKNLLTAYPHLQIFVFTPSYRNRYNSGNDPATTNSNVKTNSLGLYLVDYENAMSDTCGEYQIPCLKMYKKCGINIINATEWLSDGLHRTTKGYEKLGRQYGEFIIENY